MSVGVARNGFDIDLRYGEAREDALVHTFLQDRVEVRSDRHPARTGNDFVEYRYKDRSSGLAVTTAHWWAFEIVGLGWALVETGRLRELARAAFREDRTTVGGDGHHSQGVLIPVEWLVRSSTDGVLRQEEPEQFALASARGA